MIKYMGLPICKNCNNELTPQYSDSEHRRWECQYTDIENKEICKLFTAEYFSEYWPIGYPTKEFLNNRRERFINNFTKGNWKQIANEGLQIPEDWKKI